MNLTTLLRVKEFGIDALPEHFTNLLMIIFMSVKGYLIVT